MAVGHIQCHSEDGEVGDATSLGVQEVQHCARLATAEAGWVAEKEDRPKRPRAVEQTEAALLHRPV